AATSGDNAYVAPRPIAPPQVQFAGPTPAGAGLAIQAIEVCQAIQSADNAVKLVANKGTLVRVYIDEASVAAITRLRGEIELRTSAQGPSTFVPAMNELVLDPAHRAVRENMAASLNFRLPDAATQPG